jgi:hypothetical protein
VGGRSPGSSDRARRGQSAARLNGAGRSVR